MVRQRRTRYARDPLGLKRALSDRLLPGLVAAMALLAALALAGSRGAEALRHRWQAGAAAAVTVQLPPEQSARMDQALAVLRAMPEVQVAEAVSPERMRALLRPWLGGALDDGLTALPLPAVIELRLVNAEIDPAPLAARLAEAVPGAELEAHGIWVSRLATLAGSVQGVAVTADLGATQRDIAGRFARRIGLLAAGGARAGAALAVPALAALSSLAAPFAGGQAVGWASLPWLDLALLPPVAGAIGWATAQFSVRRWLRRLP